MSQNGIRVTQNPLSSNCRATRGIIIRGHGPLPEVMIEQDAAIDITGVPADQPEGGPRRLLPHELCPRR
jgi:hypothetical protein